ncbi:hypothetical protein [Aeromonas sp. SCS5]|uniref:hypothetical protein n=1 Tax=Aeromonas TaxID=642 RepID=UPI0009039D59|nr:hypothetical protein [Aeromonas sp. SCS5]
MNIKTPSIWTKSHRIARNLRKLGCQILAIKSIHQRPIIEIAYPTDELKKDAIELNEQVNGLRRRAYAARLGGCIIHWHEEPSRDDFELTGNMTAVEYLHHRAAGFPA